MIEETEEMKAIKKDIGLLQERKWHAITLEISDEKIKQMNKMIAVLYMKLYTLIYQAEAQTIA